MALLNIEISVSTSHLILVLLITIYLLVFTPYILYYARRFWSLNAHNVPFIHKRHPRLVLLIIVLSNTYTIILKPIADVLTLYGHGVPYVFLFDSPLLIIFIIIRVWLLFYDYNRALHALALKWSTLIAKRSHPPQLPWTFRHKWMGNSKTIFIVAVILYIIFEIPIIICVLVYGLKAMFYILVVSYALFVIFMAHLVFFVHSCRDQFYIQKEFKLMMIVTMVNVLIYCVYHQLFAYDSNIRLIISNVWITMICYVLCFIQTHWVILQYNASKKVNRSKSYSKSKKMNLEELLATKDGFDVFAKHLIREFSIENLFFLFEVMQTKHLMLGYNLVREEDIGFVVSFEWEIMDRLRRQSTVHNVNDLRKKFRYIMAQYIMEGSEYWVNVSASTRAGLLNAYHALEGGEGKLVVEASIVIVCDSDEEDEITNITDEVTNISEEITDEAVQTNISKLSLSTVDVEKINDLELNKKYIVLFDDAMRQIYMLLTGDSLQRFYKTTEYRTFIRKSRRNTTM